MPSDKKMSKINKLNESRKSKKLVQDSSDDDNDSFYSSESEDEFDVHECRKLLKQIFPSKHINKKVKAGEKLKTAIKNDLRSKSKKPTKSSRIESDEEEEDDESYVDEEEWNDDEEESVDDECIDKKQNSKSGNFNIILTVDGKKITGSEYYDDDTSSWETCDETEDTENEDDPISSDEEESDNDEKCNKKKGSKKSANVKEKEENIQQEDKCEINDNLLVQLKQMSNQYPGNKHLEKCVETYQEEIKKEQVKKNKKELKEKARNNRIYKKIIRDKNVLNDFEVYEKFDVEKQKKIIKELREINKLTRIEKPYRLTVLEADIPICLKASAIKKINVLKTMDPDSGEYHKIKMWVDTFMKIPFGQYNTLPISIETGIDQCHEFMENAQKTLNEAVYGLNDAKMQIMQMLGQLLTNPKSVGSSIAIHGPPGTGKTSLVKEGISKILNRPFAFIALGGATDSSFLEGHGYTYEGSMWGKIVQILIESKCMNPVIYFDELDKISDTPKGDEIAGILTHLTDTSQNSQFHDKYFADIDFDLSKCLFIFSYNDANRVNPILRDRMYKIKTNGYNLKQKTTISTNYLIPKIREQVKFKEEDIIIPDKTIHYIIDKFCGKEDGVRNLKRCIEIIYTKLNLYRLMKPGVNLFKEDMSLVVSFPFTVTESVVDKLIKLMDEENPSYKFIYI